MGVFKPMRTKSRPTLTYLMKQKRTLKDETDLKNSFQMKIIHNNILVTAKD